MTDEGRVSADERRVSVRGAISMQLGMPPLARPLAGWSLPRIIIPLLGRRRGPKRPLATCKSDSLIYSPQVSILLVFGRGIRCYELIICNHQQCCSEWKSGQTSPWFRATILILMRSRRKGDIATSSGDGVACVRGGRDVSLDGSG